MSSQPTLVAEGIDKSFANGPQRIQVVKPCTLAIEPGELTLVNGPSGSGKSTLLSMLSGLLQPDEGHVRVLGTDLWALDADAIDAFRLAHFGFVFQGFNLFSSLSALDNVVLPLQYQGVPEREARRRAAEALAEVGLATRQNLYPADLSGGEKQRVAVARALVKRPQLVFADEPTSSLDRENGHTVTLLLRRLAREHRCTVLAVTHDPRLLAHGDRVIKLDDGRIVSDERPAVEPQPRSTPHHAVESR